MFQVSINSLLGFASRSQQNMILGSYVSLFCLVTVILFILVPAVNVSSLPGLSRTHFHFSYLVCYDTCFVPQALSLYRVRD